MKRAINIILILLSVSCGQKKETLKTGKIISKSDEKTEMNNTNSNLILSSCVIIVSPTDKKIDSLKTKNGEENFYAIADDNQWYIGNAKVYLDSIKVKPIEVEAKGILKFKLENGEISSIDLNSFYWDILLFDGKTKPIDLDITIFNLEFEKYMKK